MVFYMEEPRLGLEQGRVAEARLRRGREEVPSEPEREQG